MKKKNASAVCLLFFTLTVLGSAEVLSTQPISEVEASMIIQAQEVAKERVKDHRLTELQSAEVLESAVTEFPGRRVVFNRVPKKEMEASTTDNTATEPSTNIVFLEGLNHEVKESVHFVLSGNVWEDGVSELWWDYDKTRYRIFTNANGLYFSGISDVEDDTRRYSAMTLLVPCFNRSRELPNGETEWIPTSADFSADQIEYMIVTPEDVTQIDEEAFSGIEAMLRYYAVNEESMRIAYENALKLRDARAAYLEANPPKKRPTWINFHPTGKSAERFQR